MNRFPPHLRSRLEVENVLRSRSVTGHGFKGGIDFWPWRFFVFLLINLVRRLAAHALARLGPLQNAFGRYP